MYVGVQNCSKSYGLYVGRELEIFLIPTACDYSLTDVEIFTSPTAIYRRGTWNFFKSQSYRGMSSDFNMFHVLRPGYTISQIILREPPSPHPSDFRDLGICEKCEGI